MALTPSESSVELTLILYAQKNRLFTALLPTVSSYYTAHLNHLGKFTMVMIMVVILSDRHEDDTI